MGPGDDPRTGVPSPCTELQLRTGAWYGDCALALYVPAEWDVTAWWPRTPAALTDREIAEVLERPAGQPPLREICRGKSRPLIIVDDLNRPTPADRVLPIVLDHFRRAGIATDSVRILLSTGTHGAPSPDSVRKKLGDPAASACHVLVHDANRNCEYIGRTSFGTPVLVDRAVLASDLVIGIGGIYPNSTAGFGGGSKLALGVLGFSSIQSLHFRHRGIGWGRYAEGCPLRDELNEIAKMIRLDTMVSLQINADREVIRVNCGNHLLYYDDEVAFARQCFAAPAPDQADVVICNAYPSDLSFTLVHQKGTAPLQRTKTSASRVVLALCTEGAGQHGLFPVVNRPRFLAAFQLARRASMMKPHEVMGAVARRLSRGQPSDRTEARNPIWLHRPGKPFERLPSELPGYRLTDSWSEVVRSVKAEQGNRKRLQVYLYPCAPLQHLESGRPG